jgi:pectate lyase
MKTVLIGHSDSNGEQDVNLEVTFHHNWFSNTDGRNPSLRFGKVHYFNNYLENTSDYGFAVRNGAHAKIENCHFESVNVPIATDKFEGHGYACISGCIYSGSCSEADNQISTPFDCEFWNDQLPYSYAPENSNTVKISVEEYAGVGIISTITAAEDHADIGNRRMNQCFYDKVNGRIQLSFTTKSQQELSFSIYNIEGRKVFFDTGKFNRGIHQIELPLHGLKKGVYLVILESSKGKVSQKMIL